MKKPTSFEIYLLHLHITDATNHVIDCLRGPDGDEAWALMEEFHGPKWSCEPKNLGRFVADTIISLGVKISSGWRQ